MKLSIQKQQLVKAAERCDVVADARGTHPHTGKLLLTASIQEESHVLQAFATDLRIQVDTAVACQLDEPGSVAVDCKRLLGTAKAMPQGLIQLETKPKNRLLLSCSGNREYSLPTVPPAEFPSPSEPQTEAARLQIPANVCSYLIGRVQASIRPDGRPNLDGVFIDYQEGVLNAVVIGAHSISIAQDKSLQLPPDFTWQALLPQFMLKSLLDMCTDHSLVTLLLDEPHIYVESKDTLVGGMLPHGPFSPWRNGLEKLSRDRVAKVEAQPIRESLKAIMVARESSATAVRLKLEKDLLSIALEGDECQARDQIMVEPFDGPALDLLIRPDYLLQTIRGADSDFYLELAESNVVISNDTFLGIISPVLPSVEPPGQRK